MFLHSVKSPRLIEATLIALLFFDLSFLASIHQGWFGHSVAQAGQATFPDLVISSISNPPSSAIAGTNFSVTDTTGNSGNDTANASTTGYRLSLDSTITTSDSLLTGTRSIPSLKKSSSSTGSITVTIPSNLTPGTYFLGACADHTSVITESNETNNCRASTTTIVISAPASISGLSPAAGPVGIPVTISGANFGSSQGSSSVRFNGCLVTPTSWSNTSITAPAANCGTGPVTVTVGGVASNGVTFTVSYAPRVNAGGPAYIDTAGNFWAADNSGWSPSDPWHPTGGSLFTTTNPIANTTDDLIYQSERFGDFGYVFNVPNGRYNVALHFAEIYSGTSGPNQRIFNVSIEGSPVLSNYDIAANVGFEAAVIKSFPGILVQDGQLNIDLVTVVGNAKISAIEITPDQPSKLGISSVNNGNAPIANAPFSVVVQSQDSLGNPVNVTSATGVSVVLQSGTGTSNLPLTGSIPAGSSQVTISNINYSKAENGVILRATRTSGDNLAVGDSAPFAVVAGSPTKLGFITQPGNSVAGNNLPGPPIVAVQDSLGNTVASSNAQITIAIGSNPGSATLTGAAQKSAFNGTGIFADLRISQPGNGYTLTASSTGLTGATSNAFNLVAGGTIAGTITRNGNGMPIGGATVEASQGGIVKRTATANSSGAYTMSGLTVGAYDVRVSAGGYLEQTQNGVSVTSGGTATVNFTLGVTTPIAGIVYIYDELQRLKSVIDPIGEAATYTYDAVGNLLGITRNNASQASVIDFNPNSGPVGTTVTIYGTGFSATPSQNSVTFNGVAATVISSTLTQIVTTMPSGATNGPIAVSSPAGSAFSSTSFTVTGAGPNAPTIANISPTIGSAGTAVTITGTNFDSTPANDEIRFSPALATVTTASTTSLNTAVPFGARSGKISVSTPGGTAVSAQDFFVPPSPFTNNDISSTERISIGGSPVTMAVSTANQVAVAIFDGNAGQKISLLVTNSTFPDAGIFTTSATIKVLKPDGYQLAQLNWHLANSLFGENFLDIQTLPMTGTYTILLDPASSYTGQATITLYNVPAEDQGLISPGGSPVTVVTTVPGQNAKLTFTGAQDQLISARISDSTYPDRGIFTTSATMTIFKPDGTQLAQLGWHSANSSFGDNFLDTVKLPIAGTYTILVDPVWTYAGQATITLYNVPAEPQGTITVGGSSVTVTTLVPGQNGRLTFTGIQDQLVSVRVSNSTYPDLGGFTTSATLNISKPDGTPLTSMGWHSANGQIYDLYSSSNFTDIVKLPSSGTYTLQVDPAWAHTGQAILTVFDVPSEPQGTIIPGGSAVTIVTQVPGQNGSLTFTANAGQLIGAVANNSTYPDYGSFTTSATLSLLKPDGSLLNSVGWNASSGTLLDDRLIPVTGTYTLRVDPTWTHIGQVAISATLIDPTEEGTITPNGPPVTASVTIPYQALRYTFSGTLGDYLTLQLSNVTIAGSTVSILKPDGTAMASGEVSTSGALLYASPLPVSGTYSIIINPNGGNVGNMTLTLRYGLALTYSGKIRDRVGQGDAALSADGSMDGTFNVTLPVSGVGARTATALHLQRSGGGDWDTTPNGSWALGAAIDLDAPLYNAANATVNFVVNDGGSFKIFGSDSGGSLFNPGATFTFTVNFADGSTESGNVTLP